jgi:hypothetical protein
MLACSGVFRVDGLEPLTQTTHRSADHDCLTQTLEWVLTFVPPSKVFAEEMNGLQPLAGTLSAASG